MNKTLVAFFVVLIAIVVFGMPYGCGNKVVPPTDPPDVPNCGLCHSDKDQDHHENKLCSDCHEHGLPHDRDSSSDFCGACHKEIAETFLASGHPYMLRKLGGKPPQLIEGATTELPPLPDGVTWEDIEYMFGGFMDQGRAYYLDPQGYRITAAWPLCLENDPINCSKYSCGSCHTTGYNAEVSDLPGAVGSWDEPGIHCVRCHEGQGSHYVANADKARCTECHNNGYLDGRTYQGQHHPQGNDIQGGAHKDLDCTHCHDPHVSVTYNEHEALDECTKCHEGNTTQRVAAHSTIPCQVCHMPGGSHYYTYTLKATSDVSPTECGPNYETASPTHKYCEDTSKAIDPTRVRTFVNPNVGHTMDDMCSACHEERTFFDGHNIHERECLACHGDL